MPDSTTGMNAPMTQASWNRVSKRANERPRLASGASRWTRASKACLAVPDVVPSDERQQRGGDHDRRMNQPSEPADAGDGQGADDDPLLGEDLAQPRAPGPRPTSTPAWAISPAATDEATAGCRPP